ncbi:hypothetical protein [Marivita hallyeonensis]|uniref:TRAP-type C4-dicarboxylate transport system, substrate-binding protein n=1 Tax=Marivita hallyeonensis TaxID=996342 RepID=A0A1M5XPF3_9RHOB|nr:hypothetical protein [Marivita hallyeonensis]SHI01153.1 TRAP-type C4-dicarboxylate transport system, substrate-binding protein [Marivita hallyeonensis]
MKRLITALGLTGAMALASAATAQTTLVYGSPSSPDGPEATAFKAFAERVTETSGGEIAFDDSYSGSVVSWGTSLTGVRDSLVDGAFLTPAFNPSELPATFAFILLAAAPGELNARTAAVAETALFGCPQCQQEWKKFNITPLLFSGSDPFQLMCKPEVSSLVDMEGKTVRAAGPFAKYVEAVGGTPVSIVPSELFEALQRGQVDCALGGVGWLRQFGLGDVVEHIVDEPLGYDHVRMPLVMNSDSWDGLSDAHKDAFISNLGFMHAEANAANTNFAMQAVEEGVGKGIKIVAMADDMRDAGNRFRDTSYDYVVAGATGMGVDGADQLVATFRTNLDKWNGIMADVGDDRAAYEAALQREIYDRLK